MACWCPGARCRTWVRTRRSRRPRVVAGVVAAAQLTFRYAAVVPGDDSSALLVPYDLVPVGPSSSPYPATALWAEPNLSVAASHMRALFDDPTRARELGVAGQRRVLSTHSLEQASVAISEALHPGLATFAPETRMTPT